MTLGSALLMSFKTVGTRAAAGRIAQPSFVLANFAFTALFAGLWLLVVGAPEVGARFWIVIVVVSLIDIVAVSFLIYALATTDLSDAYPLIALTPAFSLLTSLILLGEVPTPLGVVGVLVIVVGAYLLRVDAAHAGILAPFRRLAHDRGAQAMMVTAFLFAVMGPLFKIAIQASSTGMALAGTQSLATIWLAIIMVVRREVRERIADIAHNLPTLAALSLANFGQAMLAFAALQLTLVAYSGSVRRIEILFTVLLGALFFRERNARRGLGAAVVMLAGVVLISLGSR